MEREPRRHKGHWPPKGFLDRNMDNISGLFFFSAVVLLVGGFLAVHEYRRRAALTPEQRRAEDEADERKYEETGPL